MKVSIQHCYDSCNCSCMCGVETPSSTIKRYLFLGWHPCRPKSMQQNPNTQPTTPNSQHLGRFNGLSATIFCSLRAKGFSLQSLTRHSSIVELWLKIVNKSWFLLRFKTSRNETIYIVLMVK